MHYGQTTNQHARSTIHSGIKNKPCDTKSTAHTQRVSSCRLDKGRVQTRSGTRDGIAAGQGNTWYSSRFPQYRNSDAEHDHRLMSN